jgi:hypothetical protein
MGRMKDTLGDTPFEPAFSPRLPQPPKEEAFDGATYVPSRDYVRLNDQQKRIFDVMRDGAWRTLEGIAKITGDPTPSISARLRDLRKEKYGGHQLDREYLADGLYRYRLICNNS